MTKALPIAFTYDSQFFNVRDTLECGQIFRYKALDDGRYADYFWRFFDLDADYGAKVKRISAIRR